MHTSITFPCNRLVRIVLNHLFYLPGTQPILESRRRILGGETATSNVDSSRVIVIVAVEEDKTVLVYLPYYHTLVVPLFTSL